MESPENLEVLLLPQPSLVFTARSYGDLSSCHWNPGLGGLVWGWDSSLLRYPSQIFIHHMWVCDQHVPRLHLSYLDGCGFFNSVVVRLPFNLVSDGSEWWLFSILVAVLLGLWEPCLPVAPSWLEVDHTIFVTTTQVYCCGTKAATDNISTNEHGYVSIQLYLQMWHGVRVCQHLT